MTQGQLLTCHVREWRRCHGKYKQSKNSSSNGSSNNNSSSNNNNPELGYDENGNQLDYEAGTGDEEDLEIITDEEVEVLWDEDIMDDSINMGLWHNQIIRNLYLSY